MKLIIPIEFYRKGGVERVIIALITNLIDQVEQIVIICSPNNKAYFQDILPQSPKLIYELWSWPATSQIPRVIGLLNKGLTVSQRLKLNFLSSFFEERIQGFRISARINALIKKYESDHCLYVLINRLNPPNVSIPLSGIAYDLFWHFAPLTYPDEYVASYDRALLLWLKQAKIIYTISQKTRDDILSLFPESDFAAKLKAVPLSGFPSHDTETERITNMTVKEPENKVITFYFPSSFGIYKDHLTLIKAGLKIAKKGLSFKIVLIGKETDNLINGNLSLSQQNKTKEYENYLAECNKVYQDNQALMEQYFKGLGYCDYETVEYHYQTCDCVVFPSQYEGFGLAISEAIVRGIPVISSDLEVLKEQAVLYQCSDRIDFYERGNVDELASCLEQFISHPKPKFSAEEIKTRFSDWTWQDVAKKYVDILSSAISVISHQ
ncbi:MAG: glycosyltransferase [Microcystaceae cyanobacterium]